VSSAAVRPAWSCCVTSFLSKFIGLVRSDLDPEWHLVSVKPLIRNMSPCSELRLIHTINRRVIRRGRFGRQGGLLSAENGGGGACFS